ncbi:MAG: hypothetical protein ACE37B_23230 [Ilumatobacter sp.]|jgi:hypothetical protein|uniref:hypothetical protein n=1 Tax=Ilumatobacter sp. TaxID=1967498 RepID=UPI00391D6549
MGASKLSVTASGVTTVALCAGKDCRKRKEFGKLRSELDDQCTVVDLACVGICSGPVVVVNPASKQPLVFAKLRTKRDRRAVIELAVRGGKPTKPLRSRAVSRSTRTTTIRRVRRVIPQTA